MRLPTHRYGFTLFELLIVMAILGILVFSFFTTYSTSRQTQALRVSAEEVADKLREAHIFAREQKDDTAWGVVKSGDSAYELRQGDANMSTKHSGGVLEGGVSFAKDFAIWFNPGTGETDKRHEIEIIDRNGHSQLIEILESGVVEVGSL